MLSNFSDVNTLEKNSFNASALSSSLVAFDPLILVKFGIVSFVLSRDFAYFQKLLGLDFILSAKFVSKLVLIPC